MVIYRNTWQSIIKENRRKPYMAGKHAPLLQKPVIKPAEHRTTSPFKRKLLVGLAAGTILLGIGKSALAQDKPITQEPQKDKTELAAATEQAKSAKQDTTKTEQVATSDTKRPRYYPYYDEHGNKAYIDLEEKLSPEGLKKVAYFKSIQKTLDQVQAGRLKLSENQLNDLIQFMGRFANFDIETLELVLSTMKSGAPELTAPGGGYYAEVLGIETVLKVRSTFPEFNFHYSPSTDQVIAERKPTGQ